jgi:hypothetical protein
VQHVLISAAPVQTQLLVRTILSSLAALNRPRDFQFVIRDPDFLVLPNYFAAWSSVDAVINQRQHTYAVTPRILVVVDGDAPADRIMINDVLARGSSVGVHLLGVTHAASQDSRWPIQIVGQASSTDAFTAYTSSGNIGFTAATIEVTDLFGLFPKPAAPQKPEDR